MRVQNGHNVGFQKTCLKLISYKKEFEGKQLSTRANKFIVTGQILLLSLCFW